MFNYIYIRESVMNQIIIYYIIYEYVSYATLPSDDDVIYTTMQLCHYHVNIIAISASFLTMLL